MVFHDGSESMTIKDEHMSPGRKLLLAERHGWLPADQQLLDPTLYEVADRIAVARRTLSELLEDPTADLAKAATEFALEVERASEMLLGKEYQVGSQDERRGVLKHEFWKEIPGSDLGTLIYGNIVSRCWPLKRTEAMRFFLFRIQTPFLLIDNT